jgi:hypothetical protein
MQSYSDHAGRRQLADNIGAREMDIKTLQEKVTAGELVEKHTSLFRGYVSRKGGGVVKPYSGRFGVGYVLLSPYCGSTRYSHITYYTA